MTNTQRMKNDTATRDRREMTDLTLMDNRIKNDEITVERRFKTDKALAENRLRNDELTANRRETKDGNLNVTLAISILVVFVIGTLLVFM